MNENAQPHPYGFPEEWFYSEANGSVISYSIRAFPAPDLTKFPASRLQDFALFQRLMLSLRDLSHARSSIVFVREDVDFDSKYPLAELRRFICYETTLIVAYCRPFSESTGGHPRLSFKAIGVKPTPFAKNLHERLIEKRNQIFAHSDVSAIEHSNPRVMRGTDTTGLPFTVFMPPGFQEGTLLSRNEFEQVSVLIDTLTDAIMGQLQAMHHHFADRYPSLEWGLRD